MTSQMTWTKDKWKAPAMKRTSTWTSALHSYQTLTLRQVDPPLPLVFESLLPCPNKNTYTYKQCNILQWYQNLWCNDYWFPQANYEHLRDFFSDVGGVTAIRILKDKFTGKSRVSLSLSLSHTHTHTHTPLFWLFLSPLCMSHVNENSTGQLSCYIHFHLALKFIVVVFYIWWQETGIWNFLDTLYRSMFQVLWTISVCLVAKK